MDTKNNKSNLKLSNKSKNILKTILTTTFVYVCTVLASEALPLDNCVPASALQPVPGGALLLAVDIPVSREAWVDALGL